MKSNLNMLCSQAHKTAPKYLTEGSADGGFVCTVTVEGQQFKSSHYFKQKKLAEHNVAHVAMFELRLVPSPPEGYVKGQTLPQHGLTGMNGSAPAAASATGEAPPAKRAKKEKVTTHPVLKARLLIHCQQNQMAVPKYTTTVVEEDNKSYGVKEEEENGEVKSQEEQHRVYVSGLDKKVNRDDFEAYLGEKYIAYTGVWVYKQGFRSSKAYVNCASEADFDRLIALGESECLGRTIHVAKARTKEEFWGSDGEDHPHRVFFFGVSFQLDLDGLKTWISEQGVQFTDVFVNASNMMEASAEADGEEQQPARPKRLHRGNGYVECASEAEAEKLLALNGSDVHGRKIKCQKHMITKCTSTGEEAKESETEDEQHRVYVAGLSVKVTREILEAYLEGKSIQTTGVWVYKKAGNLARGGKAYVNCASTEDFDKLIALSEKKGPAGTRKLFCDKARVKVDDPEHPNRVLLMGVNFEVDLDALKTWLSEQAVCFTEVLLNTWNNTPGAEGAQLGPAWITGKKLHRGNGYVDCADEESYDKMMALHGSLVQGRRIKCQDKMKKDKVYFACAVEVNGVSYTGIQRRSRKDAEKAAAERACIDMGLLKEGEQTKNGVVVASPAIQIKMEE